MRKRSSLINNREAYSEGYKIGINLALEARDISFKSVNPIKALFSPAYMKSHIAGVRDGYRQGLWRYEKEKQAKRLQELSQINKSKNRENDRER